MIDLIDLTVQFSGVPLFDKANLKINNYDKIALIGSNGTGKSTLLKIILGEIAPETGKVHKQKSISIGYLPQETVRLGNVNLFNEVRSSLTTIAELEKNESLIISELSNPNIKNETRDKYLHDLDDIERLKQNLSYYKIDSNIRETLAGLGFLKDDLNRNTCEFSGGWIMRIELAKILVANHNILLLDEPTNHLDFDSLQWLKNFLINYKGAIILVSHDRYFNNEITNKTLEIDNKKIYFYNGKIDDYLIYKENLKEQLLAQYRVQQTQIKEKEKYIERFRYKATKARQVQSRIKQLDKLEKIELLEEDNFKIKIRFPEPPKSGIIPFEAIDISKEYNGTIVFENVNFRIERNDKIVIIGPNGAGKTTLSKIIAQKITPSSGEIKIGGNTIIAYYSQEAAENLDPNKNILESITGIADSYTETQLRTLLGCFLFHGDDILKKVNVLSGGEKSRVALAKILLTKANLIVLDEPTNHLDMKSKKILQDALIDFYGSLIIVSHDIDFIIPIANKVIYIRNKNIKYYFGGIDYYLKKNLERNEFDNDNNEGKNNSINQRKGQKRIEAELRQKKYSETKDLKEKIEYVENKINEYEDKLTEIEREMIELNQSSKYKQISEKSEIYKSLKNNLEELYSEWTVFHNELEKIEKNFD
ncbi:MAG: ATP-binding cassette domain-containing protein [Ignavibacteriales bacterium]|nr:ATP-binding cassette domain-containing protein [Ignavibacteriales bacterium]